MKSKGFTLIELMIVMAIIGILLAVVVPGIKGENNQNAEPSATYISEPAAQDNGADAGFRR